MSDEKSDVDLYGGFKMEKFIYLVISLTSYLSDKSVKEWLKFFIVLFVLVLTYKTLTLTVFEINMVKMIFK